jgi:hypothetical protein
MSVTRASPGCQYLRGFALFADRLMAGMVLLLPNFPGNLPSRAIEQYMAFQPAA